jgi:DNA ligase-1
LNNFSHIARAIEKLPHAKAAASNSVWGGLVFDGEVMSASFQDLMKQLYRKEHVDATDSVFHMFDVLPLSDFLVGRCSEKLTDRIETLKTLLLHADPCLQSLDQEYIDLDTADGQSKFREINRAAIDAGFEGIMIKDPMSPYECKRNNSWLKLKPFIELSLSIDSSEEGTGKHAGKLGAFQCSGVENDKHISVNVGSGFADEQRESFWAERDALVGHIVEVRADAITQNQDGTFSLRFPRFLKFRGYEAGEKL